MALPADKNGAPTETSLNPDGPPLTLTGPDGRTLDTDRFTWDTLSEIPLLVADTRFDYVYADGPAPIAQLPRLDTPNPTNDCADGGACHLHTDLTGSKGGAEGSTRLYRYVSREELDDIARHGFREGHNAARGKWFAETAEDAIEFGRKFDGRGDPIVWVEVPRDLLSKLRRWETIDGVGPARYFDPTMLRELNRLVWGVL